MRRNKNVCISNWLPELLREFFRGLMLKVSSPESRVQLSLEVRQEDKEMLPIVESFNVLEASKLQRKNASHSGCLTFLRGN